MALYIRDASQAQTWGRGPRVCVARARIRDRSPSIDLFARVQDHGWHVARTGMLVDARVPKVAPPIESISWGGWHSHANIPAGRQRLRTSTRVRRARGRSSASASVHAYAGNPPTSLRCSQPGERSSPPWSLTSAPHSRVRDQSSSAVGRFTRRPFAQRL